MRSGAGLAFVLALAAACGPPPRGALAPPDPAALDALRAVLAPLHPPPSFRATGRLRYAGPEGAIEGEVELRVAPPDRAWMQLRTRALFSLVGERVVLALPGDGFLLVYEEREDALERLPFATSGGAAFAPDGRAASVLEALCGRIPWPAPATGAPLRDRVRLGGDPSAPAYRLEWPDGDGAGAWEVELSGGDLRRLAWVVGGETRLEVQYERYVQAAGERFPARLRLRTPRSRAEIHLDRIEPRTDWTDRDFQVGGNPEPRGGVDDG